MPSSSHYQKHHQFFTTKLMEWHALHNKRTMPWKGEKNPYKIWISEIILQQTRVMQGLAYYDKFLEKFPNVESLATATDAEVFKVWEGLGYYTRCKNIIFTARHIHEKLNGVFPDSYEDVLALKGIGPYTAAAISSFAYGLPHAVVDGNVFRVLSRYFGENTPIDSTDGGKFYIALANKLLLKENAGSYNQAIMDFGATICKPQVAECVNCPLQPNCVAFEKGWVNKLPIKEKKLKRSSRWFYYFVFVTEHCVLINKRIGNDIWQSLYEFYLFEADKVLDWSAATINVWLKEQLGIKTYRLQHISTYFSQQLTHQNLQGQFILVEVDKVPKSLQQFQKIKLAGISMFAFPKLIHQYLLKYPLA